MKLTMHLEFANAASQGNRAVVLGEGARLVGFQEGEDEAFMPRKESTH